MSKLGIILNINSKTFRENPEEATALSKIISSKGGILLETTRTDHEIQEAARRMRESKIDLLGLIGGDGTLQSTLSHFLKVYGNQSLPKIAIFRGGTNNTVAASLHISGSPKSLLKGLINDLDEGRNLRSERRNLISINDSYGFIFGNGFFHNFLEVYHRKAYPSRIKGFFLLNSVLFSALLGLSLSRQIFKPFRCTVIADGEELHQSEFSAISCSSVQHIGYGCNIYSKALEREDGFHLLAFPHKPALIAAYVPGFFLGKMPLKKGFVSRSVREVTFETNEPVGYQIDGENMIDSLRFKIKTGPRLDFIVP